VQLALALFLFLAVLPQRGAAAEPAAVFDGSGSAMDLVVSAIKEDAFSAAERAAPAVGQPRAIEPLVIAVSGLEMGDISIGNLTLGQILAVWRKLFPDQPPDEKEIRDRLDDIQSRIGFPKNKEAEERRPSRYVADVMAEAARRNGLELEIVDFEWSRNPKDTDESVAEFEKKLLALQSSPAARGRPIFIVAHSWKP
jgi:hypothetical protein